MLKKINKKFLQGRTIGGIDIELKLHYVAYKLGIKKSSSRVADIGGLKKLGYDSNAWFFESANAFKIASRINPSNMWIYIKQILKLKRYL